MQSELPTVLTSIIVLSIVWGGLIFFIAKAIKSEKNKLNKNDKETSTIN